MGVHLCGRCLQPRQNAESGLHASSFRISRGRSVSKRPKTGVWLTKFPQDRSNLKPNSPAQAIERANSSRQPSFFRILLENEAELADWLDVWKQQAQAGVSIRHILKSDAQAVREGNPEWKMLE